MNEVDSSIENKTGRFSRYRHLKRAFEIWDGIKLEPDLALVREAM
jgi:hypothetical protein